MPEEGAVERPDGRAVAWASWGDPDGRPLLLIHGTPGSRLDRSPDPTRYERVDAHVVTVDRPGYGRSTVQRDRTIVSAADDAIAVADAFEWDRFSVLGVSGGCPHALAVGLRAPERVRSLGIAVGAAPSDLVDPDDLIAMNREGRRRALEEGRESLEAFLAEPAAALAADPAAALEAALADAPEPDQEMLRRADVRAVFVESLREAFVQGPLGWFDDSWVLTAPWGFELGEITTPVRLWFGEIDRNVPAKAIDRMAAQLNVESFEVIPGAGHLGWLDHEERVLSELLD